MRVAHLTSGLAALVAFAFSTAFAADAPKGGAAPAAFPGNDSSSSPSLSADGRYVAFMSLASNLVPDDTNGVFDIFLLDRNDGSIRRVSTNEFGGQADGQSWVPSLSPDGQFVVFGSNATNLVVGDSNAAGDMFRKDLVTGAVTRVSVDSTGGEADVFGASDPRSDASNGTITRGGRFVTFDSCLNPLDGPGCGGFLRDIVGNTTRRFAQDLYARPAVGVRDIGGGAVEVSIAFTTEAQLVAGDTSVCNPGSSSCQDVYLARTTVPATGAPTDFTYTLVSGDGTGAGGNNTSGTGNIGRGVSISEDGLRVAFVSDASNLVTGDTNAETDVFLYQVASMLLTRETDGVAVPGGGNRPEVAPILSADGTRVIYFDAGNFGTANWVVKPVPGGASEVVGVGVPAGSRIEETGCGALANNGTAAWATEAFDLPGTRLDRVGDVFVSSGSPRTTALASAGKVGTERDGHSRAPAISGDGRYVAFSTQSWGYEGTDPGANRDIYYKDLANGTIVRATAGTADALFPDLSGNGDRLVYGGGGFPPGGTCTSGGGAWLVTLRPTPAAQCLDQDAPPFAGLNAEPFPQPVISDDGNFAAFGAFDPSSSQRRIFIRDLAAGTLERVDTTGPGFFEDQTIQLSADGRYLVHSVSSVYGGANFGSAAVYDRVMDVDTIVSRFGGNGAAGEGRWAAISGDGEWIAFVSSDNLTQETPAPSGSNVFLYRRTTGALTRVVGESVGRNDSTSKARIRLSHDGRYVAFLVDDICTFRCASRLREVVIYDRVTNSQRSVSLTPSWGRPNGPSAQPDVARGESVAYTLDMSTDGAKIVFASAATNLAPGDGNAADDIYLIETASQTVSRVSAPGDQAAGDVDRVAAEISGDGTMLAYAVKDRDGATASGSALDAKRVAGIGSKWSDIAIQSPLLGEVVVSSALGGGAANGDSGEPSITHGGNYVAYQSNATNLTADLDSNAAPDIVLFDGERGQNVRVSTTSGGQPANGASVDPSVGFTPGNKWGVAFTSSATNLGGGGDSNGVTDVMFAVEGNNGAPPTTIAVSVNTAGQSSNGPSAQADVDGEASFVTFASLGSNLAPGDTNGTTDVFMRNLQTNQTVMLSSGPGGVAANGPSTNAVGDKFGSGPAAPPIVAFETDASNLGGTDLNGSSDVYAWTPSMGMFIVSRGLQGATANGTSSNPQVSRGGRYISYVSSADNIVVGDTNGKPDVFVFDTQTQTTKRISVGHLGQQADDVTTSAAVAVDANGNAVVAWDSAANNLTGTADPDEAFDLFLTVGELPAEPILLEGVLIFRSGFE